MQSLADMVSSLQEGYYKDYYSRHLARGMHPAEALFAKQALLALAPGPRSPEERKAAARLALQVALENLPPSSSGTIFSKQIEDRFPGGLQSVELEIEEMIFLANTATCLTVSCEIPRAQSAERVLEERRADLLSWSGVAGREPALPVAIAGGLFWLYYMDRNLGGVCMHSLPGEGQGMPVVFIDEEHFLNEEIDEEVVLRAACHEMIHSSQVASSQEDIDGWNDDARFALLEAITEGLAVCRIGQRESFSPAEISRRDYIYFVVALFSEIKLAGADLCDFPDLLEKMNALPLAHTAALLGSPKKFMSKAENAARALILQSFISSQKEAREPAEAADKKQLDFIEGVIFSGDCGLQIIDEVLVAST